VIRRLPERRLALVVPAILAVGIWSAACTAPASSAAPSASDAFMEHSAVPSASDAMMEHSAVPSASDAMMEHSPVPSPS
jgi:hypothetical protein